MFCRFGLDLWQVLVRCNASLALIVGSCTIGAK